jgi:hypothetical protein
MRLNAGETVSLTWRWEFLETGESQSDAQGDSLSFTINYLLQELPPGAGGGGGGVSDTTPPTISDISVSNITETSADIGWKTDEKSDSQVEYSSSPSKLSPLDTERVINHLVHLTDLIPGTTYHFKVMSRDAAGNLAVSGEHTFTTLGTPPAPPSKVINWSLIGGIIGGVVVAVGLLVFFWVRRRAA